MGRAQTEEFILRGYGLHNVLSSDSGTVLEKLARESESLVDEIARQQAVSRVPRDTWNLAGSRGDHPPRLNTT